jgi:hypothetical protein
MTAPMSSSTTVVAVSGAQNSASSPNTMIHTGMIDRAVEEHRHDGSHFLFACAQTDVGVFGLITCVRREAGLLDSASPQ